MNREALKASLTLHEGKSRLMYKDTNGHWTIGIGRNLEKGVSEAIIDKLFNEDIDEAVSELDRAFTGWRNHSEARQTVLVELMFNMGAPTLSQFKQFWKFMDAKQYELASHALLDSKWAAQVHGRADTLARRLKEDSLK